MLGGAETPLSLRQLRARTALRMATVGAAVRTLCRKRRIERAPRGGQDRQRRGVTQNRYRPQTLGVAGNGNG